MSDTTPTETAMPTPPADERVIYVERHIEHTKVGRAGHSEAVIGFVFSLVTLFGVGSIIAIILGTVSKSKAKAAGEQPSGLATAAQVLGWIGLAAMVLVVIMAIAAASSPSAPSECFDSSAGVMAPC